MLNATLVGRVDFGDDLCILRVRPDSGVPRFAAGQFVRLGLHAAAVDGATTDRLVKRAYSIASPPSDRDALEFYVIKVNDGRLTPAVWELPVGGRLWCDGKVQGEFTLHDVPPGRDLLMFATGTGVAPYVSMLRAHGGEGRWRRFTVVHGVRRVADLGYREELEAQARRQPGVRYVPVVSREPESTPWPGLRGRVLQLLDDAVYESRVGARLDPATTHVFLCGNPDMVQGARALLEPRGFVSGTKKQPGGNLHTERYW